LKNVRKLEGSYSPEVIRQGAKPRVQLAIQVLNQLLLRFQTIELGLWQEETRRAQLRSKLNATSPDELTRFVLVLEMEY